MNQLDRPLAELAAAVQAGEVSAEALVQDSLDRLKAAEPFHVVLEFNEQALDQARAIDQQIAKGEAIGRLAGLPYVAKDNFLTLGTHTTAASHILEPFESPYQATVIGKLAAEGAILVAKANLDAFGHGSSTEHSDFGPTKNPWDDSRVPGGSSGGPAAAVALGAVTFAIGTDTGGSNRQPSALCGVVGLKPTYGLVSRYGVVAMASSFDTIGPIARRVEDAALVLDVIAGRDTKDTTTIERTAGSYTQLKAEPKRVAVLQPLIKADAGSKQLVDGFIEQLGQAGYQVDQVDLPISPELMLACYYILVPAEISSNLERYDGIKYGLSEPKAKDLQETYRLSRDAGFGAEAKRRILTGTYVLSSGYYDAYYKQAQRVRTLIIDAFAQLFKEYDLLVGPVSPQVAPKLDSHADPLTMYRQDVMTVPASLAGLPAISLPLGLSEDLPVGLQVIAPQKGEEALLAGARAFESLINFTARPEVKS